MLASLLSERFADAQTPNRDAADVLVDVGMLGAAPGFPLAARDDGMRGRRCGIRLTPMSVLVGPVSDGSGPCPVCLERRWLALRPMAERRLIEDQVEGETVGCHPALSIFVADVIHGLLLRLLARPGAGDGRSDLYALHAETMRVTRQQIERDGLCPACSRPRADTAQAAVIALGPRPKREPNAYRLSSVRELDIPKAAYVNPVCGVLGDHAGADYTHTLTAPAGGKFMVRGTRGEHTIWWGGHANSYQESEVVGMLEGLERYAGLLPRAKSVEVFASLAELREEALDPRSCGLYPPAFYERWTYFKPFTPDLKVNWVWGYSLTQARPLLVPEQLVYYHDDTRVEPLFVRDTSSGCATGSCMEEAILHGLLELIERDAFLLTWYARLSPRRIDPWSCASRDTLQLLDRIERMDCETFLLDTRLDLQFPTVICLTRRRDGGPGTLVFSAGAGFDPETAVRGALCEVASYLPGFGRRVAEQEERLRLIMGDYRKLDKMDEHALLYGLPEMARHADFLLRNPVCQSMAETYRAWNERRPRGLDLLDDLRFCLAQLREHGLEQVVVVEQTAPEQERLGLKTARVIVPGLLPLDFGYEQRRVDQLARLRSVPRTSGLSPRDLTPEEINPCPHPFT